MKLSLVLLSLAALTSCALIRKGETAIDQGTKTAQAIQLDANDVHDLISLLKAKLMGPPEPVPSSGGLFNAILDVIASLIFLWNILHRKVSNGAVIASNEKLVAKVKGGTG